MFVNEMFVNPQDFFSCLKALTSCSKYVLRLTFIIFTEKNDD